MLCNTSGLLPTGVKYFKEEPICEIITIPNKKPDIERVLDIIVWPEIEHMSLIETDKGISNEGQKLTGYKLSVEVKLKHKLTYVADEPRKPVHATHYESLKGMFVVLPDKIDDKSMCEYIRSGRITACPYIETVYTRKLSKRTIHKSILLFLDVKICN